MDKKNIKKLKYYQKILSFLHFSADCISIIASFFCAYHLWSLLGPILAIDMYETVSFSRYNLMFGITLISILLGFEASDLYKPQRSMLNIKEFSAIFRTWIMAFMVSMIILFIADELYFSRGIFLTTWIIMFIFIILERYLFFKFNSFLSTMGFVETTVLVYGTGRLAEQLLQKFQKSPKLGYQIAGVITHTPSSKTAQMDIPILGDFTRLETIIRDTKADKLFIAQTGVSSERVIEILNTCRKTDCKFQVVPSTYEMILEKISLSDMEGIPLIGIKEPKFTIKGILTKRLLDMLIASLFLLFFAPVIFIITFITLFTTWDPVIIPQKRLGKKGRAFEFYHLGAIPPLPHKKKRLTFFGNGKKMGRLLRRWSLERYPQLWNVIIGDMSLVGPRAENPHKTETPSDIKKHKFNVRPGITGLWEISPHDESTAFLDKDLDIYYLQNQSLLLDLIILFRKLAAILFFKPSAEAVDKDMEQ
ncbi:MAG: sugar transferase [Fibrobacteria bacterium]|nr:sugar transferase [Fibrobacteria bacterium]